MNNQKGIAIVPLVIIIIVVVVIAGAAWILTTQKEETNTNIKITNTNAAANTEINSNQLLGGDTDEHGCKPSAGYSWCESKQKCLRIWEEECPAISNTNTAAGETAGWKTFESTDTYVTEDMDSFTSYLSNTVHYSIKYSSNWTLDGTVFSDENGDKIAEFSPGAVYFSSTQSCSDQSSESEWAEELERTNITIGSYSGIKIIQKAAVDGGDIPYWYPNKYCLQSGTSAFFITFYERELGKGDRALFEKILSTFQFTDEIADWKTYTDSQYNFQIKYPPTWTYQMYTNGYNNEGSYVIAFTTNRQPMERYPFISVKENWSINKEVERINTIDPPYTKVSEKSTEKLGQVDAVRIRYESTIGLTFDKYIILKSATAYIFDSLKDDNDVRSVISTFQFTD